jgi:hypothetical protein
MTFAEGMFAMPLLHAYKQQLTSRYGIWIQYLKGHMRLMMSMKPHGYKWFAADWTAFDSSVPAWLVRDAFAILRDNLDFSRYHEFGVPTSPQSLPRLWKEVVRYFINTPLKFPDGQVFVKNRGVPSGSYFTSLIDSVVNTLVMHYVLTKMRVNYSNKAFWVLGDDALVAIHGNLDVNEFSAIARQVFGLTLNESKTEVDYFPSFLGFKLHYTGVPQSNYNRLMAQLCLPRYPDADQGEFAARIRALQLASFGGNKRFLYETQNYLESIGLPDPPNQLSRFNEMRVKLESLGLGHWPPLEQVLIL